MTRSKNTSTVIELKNFSIWDDHLSHEPSWTRQTEDGKTMKFYVIDKIKDYLTTKVYVDDAEYKWVLFYKGTPVGESTSYEALCVKKDVHNFLRLKGD